MFTKKLLKAFCLSSIALSSVSAFAATASQPVNNINLAVPNLKPGFEISLGAVWLKPGASNLNYIIYNKELPAQTPNWTEQELYPSYTAGFDFGLRYVFAGSGNDVKLDWTHVYTDNSSMTVAPDASYFLGPDYQIGPNGLVIRNAVGTAKFKYDVVNLDVGQYLNFGSHVQMRFFGGVSTGFLREEVQSHMWGDVVDPLQYAGPFAMIQDVSSNFTGLGPRVGLHADYNTDSGFSVLGEAAVSALIGAIDTRTHYTTTSQQLIAQYGQTTNYQIINDQRVYQVVPGVDAKLGVKYSHIISHDALLTVSAGYQAAVYINAISQYTPATLVPGAPLQSGGIFVYTMNHALSNYSVQGPFLNAAVQF